MLRLLESSSNLLKMHIAQTSFLAKYIKFERDQLFPVATEQTDKSFSYDEVFIQNNSPLGIPIK